MDTLTICTIDVGCRIQGWHLLVGTKVSLEPQKQYWSVKAGVELAKLFGPVMQDVVQRRSRRYGIREDG